MTDEEIMKSLEAKKLAKAKAMKTGAELLSKFAHRDEAALIIDLITNQNDLSSLRDADIQFVTSVHWHLVNERDFDPTDKQIFWLRDIKDKLL